MKTDVYLVANIILRITFVLLLDKVSKLEVSRFLGYTVRNN